MQPNRKKVMVTLAAATALVGAVAGGRHLIAGSSSSSPSAATGRVVPLASAPASGASAPGSTAALDQKGAAPHASRVSGQATTASGTATAGHGPAVVPVAAVTPLVVHTATIAVRVGKGTLDASLHDIALLAAADGGYVTDSSLSGGTSHRTPVSGSVVFRVLDADFADALARVGGLGRVDDQQIKGKDVTVQVAQNAASITVLQDEVALLEKKLGQATDLAPFLQIESQLTGVEQQLQRLQAAQAVLENSAALATVTVSLSAPGAPVTSPAPVAPHAASATVAWRYLRHNTLAVLDALAVAGGWALPGLIVAALVALIVLRLARRRRRMVNPV